MQSGLVKGSFRRLVQSDLLSVGFQKGFDVPGFPIGGVHFTGLGIVDNVGFQDSNFCQPFFRCLDGIPHSMIAFCCCRCTFPQLLGTADFLLLQEQQSFGHLLQVELGCPLFIADTFALCHSSLNVHQQLEGLFFGRLLLVRLVFRLALQHRLDLVLTIAGAQSAEPDKALLPFSLHRRVLATLRLIALLLQFLQKCFVVPRLFCKDGVDDSAQAVTVALLRRVDDTLLPFPVGLLFNDGQLVF